jgi:uncharacterized protein YbjT (DUF2867 family)/ligand-binding SRPBCC domain-containing protein
MNTTVLLTGATGYIGGRLLTRLEEDGRHVRCLARQPERVRVSGLQTRVVRGDCFDERSLDAALTGVQTAYYLVHSMAAGADFAALDRRAASNFGRAAARAGVRQVIYLGGIVRGADARSAHLRSRADTGSALREGGVPVLEFRSSVVIGSGSLAFEMIRALVERLPAMVCPRWVDTCTQPIGIDDVLAYLVAALDREDAADAIVEIGGPDVVSYGDMMREYARCRGLRRLFLSVPVLSPRLSGLWLSLVTPTQARVGRALVEGLRDETVVRSSTARELFDITPMPLADAMTRALEGAAAAHLKRDVRIVTVHATPAEAFAPIRRIGGTSGWYAGNLLWRARGWLDRICGGVGMGRGRRDADACHVGDVIDGWRVDAFEANRLLRLATDLKMPGRGWLEFDVKPLTGGRSQIRQTATFDARGLLGRAYWLAMWPLHAIIFPELLRNIARRAEARTQDVDVIVYRSVVRARAVDLFRWHERPEALRALVPSGPWFRIEKQCGGVRDDATVVFAIGAGPFRVRWEARHFGFVPDRQFCDEQVRGPFSTWRHTHRVEPLDAEQSVYEDRVEYALPGGRAVHRVLAPLVRPLLLRSFAMRHRIVKERMAELVGATLPDDCRCKAS